MCLTTASHLDQVIIWQQHRILDIDKISIDSHIMLVTHIMVSIMMAMSGGEGTDMKGTTVALRGMHFAEIALAAFLRNDHLLSLNRVAFTSATDAV